MIRNSPMAAVMRAAIMAAGLAGTLALAACGNEAKAPAAAEAGVVDGLTVSNARLILAPVKGNPAAAYFDLSYEGEKGLTIRKADVAGAGSSMMHDYGEYDFKVQMMEALPVALKKGTKVSFKPGGLHVMAMEPSETLEPGSKTQITLTMSGGATHTFDAEVRAAGDER
jgi:copper(I)-binding protein